MLVKLIQDVLGCLNFRRTRVATISNTTSGREVNDLNRTHYTAENKKRSRLVLTSLLLV